MGLINEVLGLFVENEKDFPMASRAASELLSSPQPAMMAADGAGYNGMSIIWAGPGKADGEAEVICELNADVEGTANVYSARAVYSDGTELAHSFFVSFSSNTAFARLQLPADKAKDSRIELAAAALGARSGYNEQVIYLRDYDFDKVSVLYNITAPVRRDRSRDMIKVSYYSYSSPDNYDYVYPGRSENQMYLPTSGEVTVEGIGIKAVELSLQAGDSKKMTYHSAEPQIEIAGDTFSYSFPEKWEGVKLFDCLGSGTYADIDYLLDIAVLTSDSQIIKLMVTNIDKIWPSYVTGTGDYPDIKMIEKINAYLDCFAGGSRITMADGSQKAVEKLAPGDAVMARPGGAAAVKSMEKSGEYLLKLLEFSDGRKLALTDGHAVLTRNRGLQPVSRLAPGDIVCASPEDLELKQVIPECEHIYEVYSVFLEESGMTMYAEGVAVRDSDSAGAFAGRDWTREDLPEEWLTDYDNALRKGMLYGR